MMEGEQKKGHMEVLIEDLPKKLRILGKDWELKHNEDLIAEKEAYGKCYIGHARIEYTTVDGEGEPLNVAQVKDTVIHEIVHAIEETAGLGLKERQVLGLGGGLWALIAENPGLMLWLMKQHEQELISESQEGEQPS